MVRASASQSIDLGFISQVESYQKTLKNGIHSFPAWRSAKIGIAWRTSRQAYLLCPWARHLTGCLNFHVTDRLWGQEVYPSRWPSLTEELQTEPKRTRCLHTSSCIMLRTNSSNNEAQRSDFTSMMLQLAENTLCFVALAFGRKEDISFIIVDGPFN